MRFSWLLLVLTGLVWGQSFTAALRGVITDQTNAAVPNARVVITEVARNVQHTAVTDDQGRYQLSALPPGLYTMTVEASGFKRHVQSEFPLSVQQQATLDVQLELGAVSLTVEVEGTTPLVNTTIANLGQVIENKYILSLPNIARNSMSLVYLTPGVVGSGGRRGDSSTNFSANGSRNSTSDVLVDGVTVVTVEQNSGITDLKFSPSVDTVQEFKMQTNFFSAEYGQTGGAVVNMVTRSGGNNYHGTGYYFLRDDALNANDWFSNRAGRPLPAFRRDQYGGVIGGPIIRDKTFFFGGYEYTKQESPTSATISVPTALQRAGDFSQTFNASGQLMTIYNPFDTFTNASGAIERRPFAGNKIPQNMMDPVALKALSYLPLPNQTGTNFTNTNNWFSNGINTSSAHQINIKADHSFSEQTRVSGRYSQARSNGTNPNLFGDNNPAYWTGGPSATRTHAMVSEINHTFSATMLASFRYGYTYSDFHRDPLVGYGFDVTSLGLPANMKNTATHRVFPRWAPEGFQEFGTEPYWVMDRQEGVHHMSGSLSKIWGAHNLKAGGERRYNLLDYNQPGNPSGRFNFGRSVTCRTLNSCGGAEGNGLAAMLVGWATGSEYQIEPKTFSRSAYWGFFVQDDWKITNKLTLNLGMRYDFDVPRWERENRYSYWDLEAQSPVKAAGYDTRGVIKFNDDKNRSPFNADMNNWQPRIGFAFAVNPKTAIRGGYGLFFQLSRATVFGRPGTGFTINSPVVWTTDSNATLNRRLSNPFPDGILLPPGRSQGDATLLGFGVGTILPSNNRNPEYHSWNLSIQRELPMQSVLELNYTGSRGTHLFMPITTLSPLPQKYWSQGRTALQAQVTNPFYGQITDPRSQLSGRTVQAFRLLRAMPQFDGTSVGTAEPARGDSNYHALQVKWEKRFTKGFTALTHYTWSKMIDNVSHSSGNVSWLGGSTSIQNIWDLRGERALSSHDIAHRVVITGTYELPFGQGRHFGSKMNRAMDWLAGGWNLSGILLMQSGMPLQVTQSGGNIWDGTQRPNLIGDPSTSGRVQDRLTAWFNRAAFSQPAIDTPGSSPRNLGYRGPGIKTLDAALLKSISTWEGQRLEIRLEAQNATNTPMFGDPGGLAFGATNFGQITGLRNGVGPRNMQFGLKYYF
ncbi:MAG: TonB-dependent receptor [Acidobacteria bacterium]|nr:TonB-dependent receptor [Acidobacteriota bacterium]